MHLTSVDARPEYSAHLTSIQIRLFTRTTKIPPAGVRPISLISCDSDRDIWEKVSVTANFKISVPAQANLVDSCRHTMQTSESKR